MLQEFKSQLTKDRIEVRLFMKTWKAVLTVKSYDDLTEHLHLLAQLTDHLRENDIKWVYTIVHGNYRTPVNAMVQPAGDKINCHIEDYDRFYTQNLDNIITLNMIHVKKNIIDKDGWTQVVDVTSERKRKYQEIVENVSSVVGSWDTL